MKRLVCIVVSMITMLSFLALPSFAEDKIPFVYDPEIEYDYSAVYVLMFHEYSYEEYDNNYFEGYIPSEIVIKEVKNMIPSLINADNYHAILKVTYEELSCDKVIELVYSLNNHPKVMLATVQPATIYEPEPNEDDQNTIQKGDINQDSDVDMKDLLILRKSVAGVIEINVELDDSADVNNDGTINMKDVLMLRRVIAGIEKC